jgi:hypothetical protein
VICESAEKFAQALGYGRWFPGQQNAQPVSYFVTDRLVVLRFKVHSSLSKLCPFNNNKTFDPRFPLRKNFMADKQFRLLGDRQALSGPSSKLRTAVGVKREFGVPRELSSASSLCHELRTFIC